MTVSLTPKQQEVIAHILSGSLYQYGWQSGASIHKNILSIGSSSNCQRKMTPFHALEEKGLIALHTDPDGIVGVSASIEYVAITEAGIKHAEKAFNKLYAESFDDSLKRAEKHRNAA